MITDGGLFELINQAEIHRESKNYIVGERKETIDQRKNTFAVINDREQAVNDLSSLSSS